MDGYLKERVTDQIEHFYRPKALENQWILNRLRIAGAVLGALGAGLGAVSAATAEKWPAAWIAVSGTISGALTAYAFAGRFQFLITSYEATARQLRRLCDEWERLPEDENQ